MHFNDTVAVGGLANLEGLRLLDERFTKLRTTTPTSQKLLQLATPI